MSTSNLNEWKYKHDGPGLRRRWQIPLALALFLGSLAATSTIPLAVGLFVLSLFALLSSSRKILIGPRYLICGGEIVYYANVQRIDRDDGVGTLSLSQPGMPPLILQRDKFHSNARKAHKIKANQQAKFGKVADRLVLHVQAANSAADIRVHC